MCTVCTHIYNWQIYYSTIYAGPNKVISYYLLGTKIILWYWNIYDIKFYALTNT